jgi:hypothetical protein
MHCTSASTGTGTGTGTSMQNASNFLARAQPLRIA